MTNKWRMTVSGWLSLVVGLFVALSTLAPTTAHEVRPAVADAEVGEDAVLIQYRLTLEPLLAGLNLAGLEDTNDSPLSGLYDQFRTLPGETLAAQFEATWPRLGPKFMILSDGIPLSAELVSVSVPDPGDITLPRDSRVILRAELPAGEAPVQIGWDASFGPLVLRQAGDGDDLYAAYLSNGALSDPLPRLGVAKDTALQTFARFVVLGVEHIIPKGLDHILFVLGLFFFSLRLRPLVLQITTFTLAHTVTLALASLGLVTVPGAVVEPLIAASITYVAVENIRGSGVITGRRLAVIFLFGLLHGLGFASVLGELDLPPAQFVSGLIGFNIGVEIGQLSVIVIAWALLAVPFGQKPWYRRRIAVPASALIGLIGAWWVVERVFL